MPVHPTKPAKFSAADERALLERWHADGDERARAELVEGFMPFVRRIAGGYAGRGEPLEDLIQVGSVGLINAIDRFDISRGLRLTTFATPHISGEIKRYFRDHAWSMHVPRPIQELHTAITRTTAEYNAQVGRCPTVAELVRVVEASEESILEAIAAGRNYRAASLDAPVSDEDEVPRGASLGETDSGFERAEQRAELSTGLRALDERQRRIVLLRFASGLSQHEIADRVGLSQMHVSRLLRRSIDEMRAALTTERVVATT